MKNECEPRDPKRWILKIVGMTHQIDPGLVAGVELPTLVLSNETSTFVVRFHDVSKSDLVNQLLELRNGTRNVDVNFIDVAGEVTDVWQFGNSSVVQVFFDDLNYDSDRDRTRYVYAKFQFPTADFKVTVK